MKPQLLRGFLLNDVLVEPLLGRVTRQEATTHLPPKAVDVLLYLAENPGQLVSRRRLMRETWGKDGGSDAALNHAISEIRQALGDHHDHPRFIQTAPRRGYRLLVEPRLSELQEQAGEDAPLAVVSAPPFFKELMRRKVVQTAAAYLVAGWLLVQIADTTFDNLGLPWWSGPFVTILVIVGFPIALVLSWCIEYAEGRVRRDTRRTKSYLHHTAWVYLAVIGAMVISASGLGTYRLLNEDASLFGTPPPQTQAPPPAPEADLPVLPNSVAVLRFVNIGSDPVVSDGLSENLLHLLASFSELAVPSRTSTWSLAGAEMDSVEVARRLHVRYVLEGSVQQVDDTIRVTAQFIDGRSGHHLWSENYDRELSASEYFAILDDIARRVVDRLQMSLSLESSAVLARAQTASDAALEHYLLGRDQLRRPKTDESLGLAVAAFSRAIDEDAHFTEAHAGLCDAHLAWYVMTRANEHFEQAERACLRSLMLDDSLGEVYAAMGSLHRYAGRYDEAQVELEKARELLPHSAAVLEELGRVYRAQDRLELAEKTFHQAIYEEPSGWSTYKSLGNFLFRTGRYAEALPLYQHVIELAPDNPPGYNNLGVTYYMLGDFGQAIETWDHIIDDQPSRGTLMNYANCLYYQSEFERSAETYARALDMAEEDYRIWENMAASLRHVPGADERERVARERAIELAEERLYVNPKDTIALSRIALLYQRAGQPERSRQAADRLFELGWDDPDVSFILALVLLESGDPPGALGQLRQAVDMGFPVHLIDADPDFEALRGEAEFAALLAGPAGPPGAGLEP